MSIGYEISRLDKQAEVNECLYLHHRQLAGNASVFDKSISSDNQSPAKTPILLPASSHCLQCRKDEVVINSNGICLACQLSNYQQKQITQNRISLNHWKRARKLLGLPENFGNYMKLEIGQSFSLISWMIKNLDPNADYTQFELVQKILETHELLSTKKRQKLSAFALASNSKEIQNQMSAFAPTVCIPEKPLKSKRKPISSEKYNEVAIRQGSYCYWCGIAVVREQTIPQSERVIKNNSTILYYAQGQIREDSIATIDHLVRVVDGGGNQPENLVISCSSCNIERDRQMRRYNRLISHRAGPCHNCGGRFFQIDWGCCSICGAGPRKFTDASRTFSVKRQIRLILKILRLLVKTINRIFK